MADSARLTSAEALWPIVRFFVPGAPKAKGSPAILRHKQSGKPFVRESPAQRSWESVVHELARYRARAQGWCGLYPGPVAVQLFFHLPPSPGKKPAHGKPHPDIDKLVRSCLDAMSGILYADDVQVVELSTTKRIAEGEPGVWVEVMAL